MRRVITKSARALTPEEYQWCSANNYGPSGSMYDEVRYCREHRRARNSRVTMIFENDLPVAWSLKFRYGGRWHLYLWVTPANRRRGLGAILVGRARMGARGPLVVYPGSRSRRLYAPLVHDGRAVCAAGYAL